MRTVRGKISKGIWALAIPLFACAGVVLQHPRHTAATTWAVVHLSGTMSANKTLSTGTVYVIDSTYTQYVHGT